MTSPLSAAERERLARVLAMCGSSHDGEALNAARLADRLVRNAGLSWHQVIPPSLPSPQTTTQAAVGWREAVTIALREDGGMLTPWERDFLSGILRWQRLSVKQMDIVARCYAKVARP